MEEQATAAHSSVFLCYSETQDEAYVCKASSFAEAQECFERNNLDFDDLLDLNTRLKCPEVETSLPQEDGSLRAYKPRWVE